MKDTTPQWFKKWRGNEFWHLQRDVALNKKLLWILLGGLIIATLVERLV